MALYKRSFALTLLPDTIPETPLDTSLGTLSDAPKSSKSITGGKICNPFNLAYYLNSPPYSDLARALKSIACVWAGINTKTCSFLGDAKASELGIELAKLIFCRTEPVWFITAARPWYW